MDEAVKKVLEEKATKISQYFQSLGYAHSYQLMDYAINFKLRQGGNQYSLRLDYSPKKQRWKPYSVNEWVQDILIPLIQPFLDGTQIATQKQVTTAPIYREQTPTSVERYFQEALECLRLLEPFSQENIDFSILYDFARRGVRLVLKETRNRQLDQLALQALLEKPSKPDFDAAKEYLFQCLTQCNQLTGN